MPLLLVASVPVATRTVRANQVRPLARVARGVVRRRLRAVGRAAAAVAAANAGAAAVHRLRVSARRATAAITVFHPLIPRRQRRWFKKMLRRIRRAAGAARDLDVLLGRGPGAPSAVHAADASRRLADLLGDRRPDSRRRLRARLAKLPMHDWERETAATVGAVDSPASADKVASHARRRARRLVRRFLARLDRPVRTGRAIHRLRIETKKLRYALEVIAEIGAPVSTSAADRLLHGLQDRLGDYTDHAAAFARLRRWARREPDPRDRRTLLAAHGHEATAMKRACRACERWWTPSRRARIARAIERMLGGLPK
jgi:CHAD domain-containing protein